jgi:hypothetical protein
VLPSNSRSAFSSGRHWIRNANAVPIEKDKRHKPLSGNPDNAGTAGIADWKASQAKSSLGGSGLF